MSAQGADSWVFNKMERPGDQHVLGSAERPIAIEGLTVEEKVILRANGKVLRAAKEEPEEADMDGLRIEERTTRWTYGKPSYAPNNKGGKNGGKKCPPYLSAGATWMWQEGKDEWGLVLGNMSGINTWDVEEGKETESEEEK